MEASTPIASISVGAGRRALRDVADLAESIKALGLLQPIVITPSNVLVAGLHRLRACESLGWRTIPTRVIDLDTVDRQLAEIDENLQRNELTALERAESLARRKELYEARHPETRKGVAGGKASGSTRRGEQVQSADSFLKNTTAKTGASRSSVASDVQIANSIPQHTRDQLRDTPAAKSKTDLLKLARMPEPEQRAVAAKLAGGSKTVKDAKRSIQRDERAVAVTTPATSDRWTITTGDCETACASIADGSVDVIVTDPPYPKEFLSCFDSLARIAARVLKPGGSCIVMSGQSYLPEVIAALAAHLRYQWTCAYITPGGQATQVWPRKVNTFWKPLLWFVRDEYAGDWIGDVARSAPNDNDKRFHDWGQSESGMADIIERFTKPGDLVLDPFCGGGTTGVAAVARGRRFVGIDVSADSAALARTRLGAMRGAA